jgi:hypothetical protein
VQLSTFLLAELSLTTNDGVLRKIFMIITNNHNQKKVREAERRSLENVDGRPGIEVYGGVSFMTGLVTRFSGPVIFLVFVCKFFSVSELGYELCLKVGFEKTCRRMWGRELGPIECVVTSIYSWLVEI